MKKAAIQLLYGGVVLDHKAALTSHLVKIA